MSTMADRDGVIWLDGELVPMVGERQVYPEQDRTYTLRAESPAGFAQETVAVGVVPCQAPEIVQFDAIPDAVKPKESVRLSWWVLGASERPRPLPGFGLHQLDVGLIEECGVESRFAVRCGDDQDLSATTSPHRRAFEPPRTPRAGI